mgnify:CR=1 FL=1
MEQNNCYLEEEKLFRLMLKSSIPWPGKHFCLPGETTRKLCNNSCISEKYRMVYLQYIRFFKKRQAEFMREIVLLLPRILLIRAVTSLTFTSPSPLMSPVAFNQRSM